ncbi:MAG TPA: DUF6602 domain-containing protein [Ktedonobacteraceae bacterium]
MNEKAQKDLKFELELVFRSEAADILAAREKAHIMHHGHDIHAAGDEVEITVRKMLGRKLPSLYYVGHGHIIDEQLHQSSQLDVIIANNTGAPILFRAENGSEYFPYESVYAIGEVKSSYDNSKHYIQAFTDTLKRIQDQLQRESFQTAGHFSFSPRFYGNPLFSFMFFAEKGDFHVEQIRDLYRTRPESELPTIVCILNKGLIVNTASHVLKSSRQKWKPAEQGQPGSISLIPARNDEYRKRQGIEFHWVLTEHGDTDKSLAANLANFYYPLIQHLQHCQLTAPNLTEYMNHLFDTTTSTFIT